MVRNRKKAAQMNFFNTGDAVEFIWNDERKVGMISRIYESPEERELYANVIVPPNQYKLPLEALCDLPSECEKHGVEKLYSKKKNSRFCPFCES